MQVDQLGALLDRRALKRSLGHVIAAGELDMLGLSVDRMFQDLAISLERAGRLIERPLGIAGHGRGRSHARR